MHATSRESDASKTRCQILCTSIGGAGTCPPRLCTTGRHYLSSYYGHLPTCNIPRVQRVIYCVQIGRRHTRWEQQQQQQSVGCGVRGPPLHVRRWIPRACTYVYYNIRIIIIIITRTRRIANILYSNGIRSPSSRHDVDRPAFVYTHYTYRRITYYVMYILLYSCVYYNIYIYIEGDHRRSTTNAPARAGFLPRRVFRIVFSYYHIIIIVSARVPI